MLVHADDDNYVKFDAISDDGANRINRIELRSEVAGVMPDAAARVRAVPAGTTKIVAAADEDRDRLHGRVLVRRRRPGTALRRAVTNAMVDADVRPVHARASTDSGDTVTFDYFKVDGKTGCPGEEPENTAPVIGDPTATPTSGMAPLHVDFAAAATDADEDELTYSWDFGDGGTSAEQNPSHTYDGGRRLHRRGDGERRRGAGVQDGHRDGARAG